MSDTRPLYTNAFDERAPNCVPATEAEILAQPCVVAALEAAYSRGRADAFISGVRETLARETGYEQGRSAGLNFALDSMAPKSGEGS